MTLASSRSPRQIRSTRSLSSAHPSFASLGTISALITRTRSSPCGSGIHGTAAMASKSPSAIFSAATRSPRRRLFVSMEPSSSPFSFS